jgi:hypothetical protein
MANLVPLHIDKDSGDIIAQGGASSGGSGKGFLYEQNTPALVWSIAHNIGSDQVLIQVYDEVGELTFADKVEIVDASNVEITFLDAMAGTAHLVFFTVE